MNEIAGDAKEIATMMSSTQLIEWAQWIIDTLDEGNIDTKTVAQFRATLGIVFEALEMHTKNLVNKY